MGSIWRLVPRPDVPLPSPEHGFRSPSLPPLEGGVEDWALITSPCPSYRLEGGAGGCGGVCSYA